MSACLVPDCLALAIDGGKCALHQFASTARAAGVVEQPCVTCNRKFQKADYVTQAPDEQVGKKKTLVVCRWRHVACEPPVKRLTKRDIAESVKPLFKGQ